MLLIPYLASLLAQEKRRPLRFEEEPKIQHDLRNLLIGLTSALVIQMTEKPLIKICTDFVKEKEVGLLHTLKLPKLGESIAAVILLDYTLYLWHVLNHKEKHLWKFHRVHHLDKDLTATTALRFHFGEMALSSFWRALQVLLIGVGDENVKLWQKLTLFEILFHHSNIRLPNRLEKLLSLLVVTPRMHTIHHSSKAEELNANWSSGLTIWDWLHGTLKKDADPNSVVIGVPEKDQHDDLSFKEMILLPFMSKEQEKGCLPDER